MCHDCRQLQYQFSQKRVDGKRSLLIAEMGRLVYMGWPCCEEQGCADLRFARRWSWNAAGGFTFARSDSAKK